MQIMTQPNQKNSHSEIPIACVACRAREGGVCGTLSPSQLAQVVRKTARRRVQPQIEIIGQGDGIEHCAAIVRGVVKLSKMLADGRQQIVGLQFAPDFLGTPFLRECSLSAEAVTNVDLCVFPRALIERLAAEAPDLQRRLHVETLKKLCAARDWMLTLGRKTAKERVANFLYLVATRINFEDGPAREFDLPLSRADIADYLGLTIETVSRQITRLRKEGVIRVENRRRIIVPDIRRLMKNASIDS